jgi:hypothetical protein
MAIYEHPATGSRASRNAQPQDAPKRVESLHTQDIANTTTAARRGASGSACALPHPPHDARAGSQLDAWSVRLNVRSDALSA